MTIKSAAIYTYEDDPVKVRDLNYCIDDNVKLDCNTGKLAGDEYVIQIVFHTKTISPDAASGDDIFKLDLDLTTDGDVDSARVLLESW